jgi:hypothetical protein
MADETKVATPVAEMPKTESELMQEMTAAVKSGDYKAVAKVAQELVKVQKVKESTELAAKIAVLTEKTLMVKGFYDTLTGFFIGGKAPESERVNKFASTIKKMTGTELDQADGVWFSNDFGEKLTTCRLVKTAAKTAKAGGTGGGKKFAIGTAELLEKHGSSEYKDGLTFKAAFDSNTDKNYRYAIREALLKKDGVTS